MGAPVAFEMLVAEIFWTWPMTDPFSPASIDVSANRSAIKWTGRELLGRAIWETFGAAAFWFSPRPLWGYRNWILRIFGAKIGQNVRIHPTVKIMIPWHLSIGSHVAVGDGAILYSLGLIQIGARATVSQYAHLCAGSHDYNSITFDLLKAPITIGEDAWICADAFVGPGVTIGRGAIVGARAVVTCSLPDEAIVAGNPARIIKWRNGKEEKP
jgi:putative colanic acid biosynthesis acetyltransferase WcaF